MTKLPNVTVSGLVLSDLFFNSETPNYKNAIQFTSGFGDDNEADKARRENAALLQDANDFAAQFDGQVTGQALFDDYMARL
jgi:hypothetical protein